MAKYHLLQDLLPWIEKFEQEQEGKEATVHAFQEWLSKNADLVKRKELPAVSTVPNVEGEIARYVSVMNRYAKFYLKKALAKTELGTIDDFGYLIYLMEMGSTTKTNLIHKNVHDIPSGTEIIKRLIRKGWINEIPDQTDKRKVQVSINAAGKAALLSSFKEIEKVSKIISANLEPAEKEQLLRILKKLDAFHWSIFENRKGKSLEELMEL
jgi:DNA-binding MarR family transcriptional regulator